MVLVNKIALSWAVAALLGQPLVADEVRSDESVAASLSFNEQIRPILSNHCWSCHGPDEESRAAGLRLDHREGTIAALDSGQRAIVPGNPDSSELIRRIQSADPDMVMPPPSAKKPLTQQQKQVLQQWIREGADFAPHWAFIPPTRPPLPTVSDASWPETPIDHFVLKQIEDAGLQPSPEAAPETWLRRVSLDLTGLPPSLSDQKQFLQSLQTMSASDARRGVVDRLLSSPRYAERMAMQWLDWARFADTNGYNNDEVRTLWPWRDWVIQAFADNMPLDQFIRDQLAGDLLPNATLDQKVASGFNRNHVLTTEGGVIEEEYHVEYVADRVHTTATVFLALSMQCARCHDHKYDPITQKEYYQFAAFFNNVPDKIVSYSSGRMAEPLLKVPSAEQRNALQDLQDQVTSLEEQLRQREREADTDMEAWIRDLTEESIQKLKPAGLLWHFPMDQLNGDQIHDAVTGELATIIGKADPREGKFLGALAFDGRTWISSSTAGQFDSDDAFSLSAWFFPESAEAGTLMSRMDDASNYRGYDVIVENGRISAHFVHQWPSNGFKIVTKDSVGLNEWHHVVVTYDGSRRASGVKVYVDGVSRELQVPTDNLLSGSLRTDMPFHIGRRQTSVPFRGLLDEVQLYKTCLDQSAVTGLANGQVQAGLAELLLQKPSTRSDVQQQTIRRYFLEQVDEVSRQLKTELSAIPERRRQIEEQIPVTMIMAEMPDRRPAFLLKRGAYDQRGEQVQPGLPAILTGAGSLSGLRDRTALSDNSDGGKIASRLDLAEWLTQADHPLTARVAVNRWWEMLFGIGLVETSEDFGIQGAMPSHPQLLDWLSRELVENSWDQQHILKTIVLSATYRQSSRVTPPLLETDPKNRLLARGPRYRLPAEMVRDNALFVSGLLTERVGGASVRPWQPEGLWEDVSVERRDKYVPDKGEGRYRRSMYTFWKRTCPPPAMAAFDAPDRETCVIRRARTNTPLQALVLMNDPTYIEAARALAETVLREGTDDEVRVVQAFRRVLARTPNPAESATVLSMVKSATTHFSERPQEAAALAGQAEISDGSSDAAAVGSESQIRLAAWTTAMSMLLNTDEAISKP